LISRLIISGRASLRQLGDSSVQYITVLATNEPVMYMTRPRRSPTLHRSEFPDIAIFWVPEAYTLGQNLIMGRQSAGAGFIKAVAAARPQQLFCYAKSKEESEVFKRVVESNGGSDTTIHWIPWVRPKGLRQAGLLYRPDANIASDAWRRAAQGDHRAYSICGVTHTMATHVVMEAIASLVTAPLHTWDALVCTSRAARDSVRSVLEAAGEHLKDRLGATRFPLPQIPLIPLGVDCAAYTFDQKTRVESRRAMGIEPDEVVISYVGRLSFHGKAHHVPMYLALEQAAHGHQVVLLQTGFFPSKSIETAFHEEARLFCPSVRCIFLDGRDPSACKQTWAATDIFTSLVDNFQESFGLTPIEAMAAGIPSVVSDWNGYRDTVRNGIDGFRVPTLSMPPGTGGDIADRYDLELDAYDFYMFHGSQLVAVDVDAAAEAYRKLISDRDLRARMGEAARKRALASFDWAVIRAKYVALWEELAERRCADPTFHSQYLPRRRPDRADPFTMFASYPTRAMEARIAFQRCGGCSVDQALARLKLNSTGKATAVLPTPELVSELMALVPEDRWITFENLLRDSPNREGVTLGRAAVWLCKFGILRSRMSEGK
jgi:glycosyltransferase involved in cell wall biosynthesis